MSRFDHGWVRSHRKLFVNNRTNKFYGDHAKAYVFLTLISWANYEEGKTLLKKQQITLKRGQVATSQREILDWTGLSRKVVERCLKTLEMDQAIEQQKGPHGSVITICNYDSYQSKKDLEEQQKEQQKEQQRSHTGAYKGATQGQYNEEVKKERNKELSIVKLSSNSHNSEGAAFGSPTPSEVGIDARKIFNLWNETCSPLSKVRTLTPSRSRKVKIRLAENPNLDYWSGIILRMAKSEFCCSGNWATFDWLFTNDTNHIKVAEGKYDNRKTIDNTPQPVERNDL